MADITADTPVQYEACADELTERWKIDAGLSGSLYAGQIAQLDGSTAGEVKNVVATATADFAGVLLEGGAAGKVVSLRRRGILIGTIVDLVSAGDEGAAVYALSNNPHDLTTVATLSMPIGTIARVITAGTAVASGVAVFFEADDLTSR